MRRAVIFVTLALLLLAVAGVTVAQEGAFQNDGPMVAPSETASVQETTATEVTAPEATVPEATEPEPETREGTNPETTTPQTSEQEQTGEGGASEEKTTGNGTDKPKDTGRSEGIPEVERGGVDEPEDEVGNEAGGGGQQKATVCHKGKETISVGAPAQRAHLRHGDVLGACDASGGGPEAVRVPNGSGGGPPDGKGRPDGAGKPDDAGKKNSGEPRVQGRGNGG